MTERRDARNKPTARFMMRRTKTRHPHPRARSSSALSPLQAHSYIMWMRHLLRPVEKPRSMHASNAPRTTSHMFLSADFLRLHPLDPGSLELGRYMHNPTRGRGGGAGRVAACNFAKPQRTAWCKGGNNLAQKQAESFSWMHTTFGGCSFRWLVSNANRTFVDTSMQQQTSGREINIGHRTSSWPTYVASKNIIP